MLLTQNDDDEDVGEEGHGKDGRHDEAIDGNSQLGRAVPGRAVDVVALALVPAVAQDVHLDSRGKEKKKRRICNIFFRFNMYLV